VNVVASLNAACAALRGGGTPGAIASRWGTVAPPSGQMLIVTPDDPTWERVRVLVDDAGHAHEIVFERPDGAEIAVADLLPALGVPKDEEEAIDGPIVLWFDAPDGSGCLISATLRRRSASNPATCRLSVVAPRR
jgi:hypothetical protein